LKLHDARVGSAELLCELMPRFLGVTVTRLMVLDDLLQPAEGVINRLLQTGDLHRKDLEMGLDEATRLRRREWYGLRRVLWHMNKPLSSRLSAAAYSLNHTAPSVAPARMVRPSVVPNACKYTRSCPSDWTRQPRLTPVSAA